MMTPRGYQIEAHDATFREWETRRATLLEMATGTGKTVVFSLIAASRPFNGDVRPARMPKPSAAC